MCTRDEAYRILMGEMGTEGGEKYWNYFTGGHYVSPGGTAYCAYGVSWVYAMAGVRCPHFPSPWAHDYRFDLGGRDVGRWELEPMDAISFDFVGDGKGDHEGIFLRYLDDGLCETAEFNTGVNSEGYNGGCNQICVRYVDSIICGIRPYWEEDEVTSEDIEAISERAAQKVIDKLSEDMGGNGITLLAGLVWGARNRDLEERDAYQILRDVRTALGIRDGQRVPPGEERYNARVEDCLPAKIAAKVGA